MSCSIGYNWHFSNEFKIRFIQITLIIAIFSFVGLIFRPADFCPGDVRSIQRFLQHSCYNVFPDEYSWNGFKEYIRINLQIVFSDPHGIFPNIIIGPVFRILDYLGVTFSLPIFYLPSLFIALLASLLMYFTIIRSGCNSWLAFCGTMLLLLSPVYCQLMRTIGWMYIARIVFNQALILWAFQRYEGRRLSQIILSATLVFVISSDNLAPLNLAAILTAFLFKDWDICRKKRNINLIKMFLNLKQLGKLYVWLPSILMSLLMVIIFFLGRLKIFGIYETTFERSFFGHVTADAVQEGHTIKFNLSPARMFHSMTYLFGELSIPIIFLSLIGLIWMLKNNRFKKYGLTSYFALISSLGYSILWFFLYSDFSGGDFIVSLCLPFILTVVIWANEIISKHAIPAITIIVALAVSSAAANLELVWNKNGILFIDNPYKTSTTASYSILKDNVGNKSIGFLIREIMKLSLKDGKINTFQFSGNDLTNRYSALRAFAGLTQDAQDLSCQFKAKLIFTESIDSRTICQLPCSKSSNPKIIVIKIQSVATAANDNFTSEKICHAFNFKDHTGVAKTTLFVITDNSSLSLYCHPGDYPVDIFDQLYDSTYNKLYDYYPISL